MDIYEKLARCESAGEIKRMLAGNGKAIVNADTDWAFMAQVVSLSPEKKRAFMAAARALMQSS